MKFAVVGAGALGNEVVKNLGLLGAGSVTIIDPDKVESSNLSRSVFFRPGDCDQPKADTLRTALASAFTGTQWEARNCEIADVGFGELCDTDLIFTCVDTDLARVEAAWTALRLDIPMADAGLGGADYWRGRVSFFAGTRSACFCCKLSPRRRRELLSLALANGHSCWAELEATALPSTPTMAAIVGALQVDYGLRSLAELGKTKDKDFKSSTFEVILDSMPTLTQFTTAVNPGCPLHAAAQPVSVAPRHAHASAREILDSTGALTLELDWPVCVAACCLNCGCLWKPMRRVAWLRRHGSCSRCGSHRIIENETISSLDRRSAWLDTPLTGIGLPANHLYSVRAARGMDRPE